MATTEKPLDVHPFERSGLGSYPFRYVGFWSTPSKAIQEANPEAYNNAWKDAPKLDLGSLCSCGHCGMSINNHCLIRNAEGKLFAVGCDCVEKTDEPALRDPAKKALALHVRALRNARRQAKHEAARAAYLAEHGPRLAREQAERAAKQAMLLERSHKAAELLAPLAASLKDHRGGFCDSVARDLERGNIPTGQGLTIMLEILSKKEGRLDSKAYWAEHERLQDVIWHANKALDPEYSGE